MEEEGRRGIIEYIVSIHCSTYKGLTMSIDYLHYLHKGGGGLENSHDLVASLAHQCREP